MVSWVLMEKNEKTLENFLQCDILTAKRVYNFLNQNCVSFANKCEIGWFLLLYKKESRLSFVQKLKHKDFRRESG